MEWFIFNIALHNDGDRSTAVKKAACTVNKRKLVTLVEDIWWRKDPGHHQLSWNIILQKCKRNLR